MTMEGVIRKEDEFIIKIALNHYKKRLGYFRGNESIKRLAHEYFGFDKRIKVEVYLTIIASSLRQYQADLAEMRQEIKDVKKLDSDQVSSVDKFLTTSTY